jgi:hypothetical protein
MKITNYSYLTGSEIISLIPKGLCAEEITVFPDINKVQSLIPTGMTVFTKQKDWRKFAVSDIGCGMLLCKSEIDANDFNKTLWDEVLNQLIKHPIGDLNIGNHFLDAIVSRKTNKIYFLIHCGENIDIQKMNNLLTEDNILFDNYCTFLKNKAKENRFFIFEIMKDIFGQLEIVLDKCHNSYEHIDNGVIIRRGAVKIYPEELSVIPSHMCGEIALVSANQNIEHSLFSLCHGTGRVIPRDYSNSIVNTFDHNSIRERLYIPEIISTEKLILDIPICYRDLDECLTSIKEITSIVDRFKVIAYIGQFN